MTYQVQFVEVLDVEGNVTSKRRGSQSGEKSNSKHFDVKESEAGRRKRNDCCSELGLGLSIALR